LQEFHACVTQAFLYLALSASLLFALLPCDLYAGNYTQALIEQVWCSYHQASEKKLATVRAFFRLQKMSSSPNRPQRRQLRLRPRLINAIFTRNISTGPRQFLTSAE